jgi:hypothetical protein
MAGGVLAWPTSTHEARRRRIDPERELRQCASGRRGASAKRGPGAAAMRGRGRGRAPAVRGQARANSGRPWEGFSELRPNGAMGSGEPPPSSGHGRCRHASRRAAAMGDAGEQAGRASREARRASRRKWRPWCSQPRSLSYGDVHCHGVDLVNACKGNKNRMRKEYPDSYGPPKQN